MVVETPQATHHDLCIIGSGSANSLIDEQLEHLSIAQVERGVGSTRAFGGTCLNVGCIPTKMYAHPATLAASVPDASRLGVDLEFHRAHWAQIRDRIFGRIDQISSGGRDWRHQNENVTLLEGEGRFVDAHTLDVTSAAGHTRRITADRFVIATGSRPRPLEVPGADDVTVHTSDDIMRLDALPASLIVLGGGFISAEFAHVFASFGVRVEIINRSGALLRQHDAEISQRFTEIMAGRLPVHLNEPVVSVARGGEGVIVRTKDAEGVEREHTAEALLNATGRIPNSDDLGLDAAGVTVDGGRVVVDEHQRTSQPHIFALGDVSSPFQLKHVANHEARVVQHNLLHPEEPATVNHDAVPAAVFGHPQIAAVGLTESAAREEFDDVVTVTQPYGSVAYGWAMEDEDHFCKLVARRDGTLLGAHIIGPEASILIQPLVQAMATGLDARSMATGQYWIHPALTELVENALLALPLDRREP